MSNKKKNITDSMKNYRNNKKREINDIDTNGKINIKENLKYIFKIYGISRIVLVILMIISEFLLSSRTTSDYYHVLELFDNEHYLNIAMNGYRFNYEYAFFPLVPLLIRYLGKAGFILFNQVCVFFTGVLLYLISNNVFNRDKNSVYYATLLYFLSPISIFTCMFYTEGLFIFLTVLVFYIYKTKKNYLLLGILLGLSVMTRNVGSMLFFSIFVFMFVDWLKKREKLKNILIVYVPATIISCLYPIFLYTKTGDLLYFVTVQYTHWGKVSTNIFMILFDAFKYIFVSKTNPIFALEFIMIFSLIIYIFWYIFKHRKEKEYYVMFLYMILTIISICSSIRGNHTALASFHRFIFDCFPIYFMFKKNNLSFNLILMITSFTTTLFLLGYYFF